MGRWEEKKKSEFLFFSLDAFQSEDSIGVMTAYVDGWPQGGINQKYRYVMLAGLEVYKCICLCVYPYETV